MIVKEEEIQRAVDYMKNTDEPAAAAKGVLSKLEDSKKTILAIEFLKHKGSAAECQKRAEASDKYCHQLEMIAEAVYDFELLRNRRSTATTVIDIWRSENANRRTGNI